MMTLVKSLQSGRNKQAGRPDWPMLSGFSDGESLRLPPGDILAQEGVRLSADSACGNRAVALGEEAWIAGRQDHGNGWYALWCPYASRWEILSFEVQPEPATAPARHFRQARRRLVAGH